MVEISAEIYFIVGPCSAARNNLFREKIYDSSYCKIIQGINSSRKGLEKHYPLYVLFGQNGALSYFRKEIIIELNTDTKQY